MQRYLEANLCAAAEGWCPCCASLLAGTQNVAGVQLQQSTLVYKQRILAEEKKKKAFPIFFFN